MGLEQAWGHQTQLLWNTNGNPGKIQIHNLAVGGTSSGWLLRRFLNMIVTTGHVDVVILDYDVNDCVQFDLGEEDGRHEMDANIELLYKRILLLDDQPALINLAVATSHHSYGNRNQIGNTPFFSSPTCCNLLVLCVYIQHQPTTHNHTLAHPYTSITYRYILTHTPTHSPLPYAHSLTSTRQLHQSPLFRIPYLLSIGRHHEKTHARPLWGTQCVTTTCTMVTTQHTLSINPINILSQYIRSTHPILTNTPNNTTYQTTISLCHCPLLTPLTIPHSNLPSGKISLVLLLFTNGNVPLNALILPGTPPPLILSTYYIPYHLNPLILIIVSYILLLCTHLAVILIYIPYFCLVLLIF